MPATRSRRVLLGLSFLLAGVGASCSPDRSDAGEAIGRITSVQGAVELTHDGSTARPAEATDLYAGDSATVNGSGRMRFRLQGDGDFELIAGRADFGPSAISLDEGVVLISSENPVRANFESVQVAFTEGTVRVEEGTPGRVAAYDTQELKVAAGASQQVPIPRLWQVSVTEDGELEQARPVQYSRDDPVDAVHLAHALEVDDKLGNLLRGAEPQLAATDGSALSERLAAAGIDRATLTPFAETSRSDRLMGLAFAREWRSTEIPTAFEQVMALRVLGATWGLVAQNFDVSGDALVASLQIELTAVLFPDGSGGQLVPPPAPSSQRSPGRRSQPPAPPVGAPAPVPGPAAPVPSPAPTGGLLGPVVDPLRPLLPDELEAIIDELYGLVNGLVPLV